MLDAKEEKIEGKGADGLYKWMEVTSYGEPICINEYATMIAALPFTHVLQLNDFQSDAAYYIKKDHINYDTQFYELVLETRPGRLAHSFVNQCDLE